MKHFKFLTIFLLFAVLPISAESLYVGEFNIRYDNGKDTEQGDGWEVRCPVVCDILKVESFDIFGSQEVLHNQLEDILAALPEYGYVGVGRNDGKTEGEYAAIFYKMDRIKCLSSGHFWLSETPEIVGSKGWDAKYPRICTWGQFKDRRTGKKFWMFNLHMDHRGVEARKQSAMLVMERIKTMCGNQPYILLGDFNVDQFNPIYPMMMDSGLFVDCHDAAAVRFAPTGSMNYFKPDFKTDSRIDHVLVSDDFDVLDYTVLTYSYWSEEGPTAEALSDIKSGKEGVVLHRQRLPSDHYPVGIHLKFK
ncbi:MAG: endonuclease/exonuclease/phosphatase family protein [Bacteroidales bacterium]|nr:endonuclease/exonuclease/phosphatase family protein [Bacteroidales bacterium]